MKWTIARQLLPNAIKSLISKAQLPNKIKGRIGKLLKKEAF